MNNEVKFIKNNLSRYKYVILSAVLLFAVSAIIIDVYRIKQSERAIGLQKTDADYLNDDNWELTFSDEFNGAAGEPDQAKWSLTEYNVNYDYNNPTIQPDQYWLYTRKPNPASEADGWWLPQNVALDGSGNAVISLTRENDINGDNDPGLDYDYATGVLTTRKNMARGQHEGFYQKYGKYEVEFELNSKSGWWTAFWLMPDNRCVRDGNGGCNIENASGTYATGMDEHATSNGARGAEVDIFEHFGLEQGMPNTIHINGYSDNHAKKFTANCLESSNDAWCNENSVNRLPDDFFSKTTHKATLIWTPEEYRFYIDDKLSWATDYGLAHVPQSLLISAESDPDEVHNTWIGDPGALTPAGTGKLDEYKVNYVRVYKYTPKAPTLTAIDIDEGTTAGGTDVVLTGTNFDQINMVNNSIDPLAPSVPQFEITVDGTPTTQYEVLSDTSIRLTMPAHAAGKVNVGLSINGNDTEMTDAYTYAEPVDDNPDSGSNTTPTPTPTAAPTPNKPNISSAVANEDKNKVLVTWSGDAPSYEYRYRVKGATTWIETKTTSEKQVLLENLVNSEEYEFAVRSVNNGVNSDWESQFIVLGAIQIGSVELPNTGNKLVTRSVIGSIVVLIIGTTSFYFYRKAS